jgi:predicted methyltransferase
MTTRRNVAAAVLLAMLCACASTGIVTKVNPPVGQIPVHIQRAVNSSERPDAARARDAGRKPKELLTLAGLKEGDRVIELASFGQYYTMILSDAVGPRGKVYMYDLPYMKARAEGPSRAFVAGHPNTEYTVGKFDEIEFPKEIDLVTINLYYHDLQPNGVDTAALNRKLYNALRKGGRVLVEDHKAEVGSGWRDAKTRHRMETSVIVTEMKAAGFDLLIDSNVLVNPADDRTKTVFEKGYRGTTDRAVYVFVKRR